jgi:hypothetical protein
VEAEQKAVLEHPRWRGYPPGMGVEAIAHRSSLSTGRGRKTGSTTFIDEARAPVAGGGPATGRRERELGSTFHGRKATSGGSGSAHRGRARDGGGSWTATVARSDSGLAVGRVVGTPAHGPDSALKVRERRGRVAATRRRHADRWARCGKRWLIGGPHSLAFSILKLPPDEK